MIEKTVLTYLSDNLDVPVYMETPKNPPSTYVLLEKTASSRTNRVTQSQFAVQSYGARLIDAAELNEQVKTVIDNMASLTEVGGIGEIRDYNFTDTRTERYRYQCIFVVSHVL